MSFDERKRLAEDTKKHKDAKAKKTKDLKTKDAGLHVPLQHAHTYPRSSSSSPEHADFEDAIQRSVVATSKGNPDEDALIEKAIRASVLELQRASKEGDDKGAVYRAVQASMAEASRTRSSPDTTSPEHSEQLKAALHQSLQHRPSLERTPTAIADLDFDDSGIDTDDDENIKNAVESSKRLPSQDPQSDELERALAESRRLHEDHELESKRVKSEEDIILEYVKRQSLAEATYKEAALEQRPQLDGHQREIEGSERAADR